MNKERLLEAGILYGDGVHRCAGDESLYHKLLQLMLEDENFVQAKAALAVADYDTVFRCCHELRGISGTVSFTKVYELAGKVVDLCRVQDYEAIAAVFDELSAAYSQAIEAVKTELG